MKTEIDNNQRVFILYGTGWSTQKFFCNMEDIVKCAKEFEKNQPYEIYHIWNYQIKRLSVKTVIELLEANQKDASFFKKPEFKNTDMIKVKNFNGYDFYTGESKKGKYYNIVPENQETPKGGYYNKEYILNVKKLPDLFI